MHVQFSIPNQSSAAKWLLVKCENPAVVLHHRQYIKYCWAPEQVFPVPWSSPCTAEEFLDPAGSSFPSPASSIDLTSCPVMKSKYCNLQASAFLSGFNLVKNKVWFIKSCFFQNNYFQESPQMGELSFLLYLCLLEHMYLLQLSL